MTAVLDHLVLTVPDLETAVEDLERRTGVRPVAGGSHPGRTGQVRMFGWAVRATPDEFAATLSRAGKAGIDVGQPVSAARETPAGLRLSWQLAVPDPLGLGGVQPFLIAWGDTHPTDAGLPSVELESLSVLHPEPKRARTVLSMLGVEQEVRHAAVPRVQAVLRTPRGEVVLG